MRVHGHFNFKLTKDYIATFYVINVNLKGTNIT